MCSTGAVHISTFITALTAFLVAIAKVEKLQFEVEIKRNGESIAWDEKLSNIKSSEFKQLVDDVKWRLKIKLRDTQEKPDIKIKSCRPGSVICLVEWKFNSDNEDKISLETVEERLENLTVDIGDEDISWSAIELRLQLDGVQWTDEFNHQNSSAYQNLTSQIEMGLEEAYQNSSDVFGFKIVELSKSSDDSVVVQFQLIISSDSELEKNDLEETLKRSATSGSFERMTQGQETETENPQLTSSMTDETGTKGGIIVLIVFAVILLSMVIVAFLTYVLRQQWKLEQAHSPKARYEAYMKKRVEHVPEEQTYDMDLQEGDASPSTISVQEEMIADESQK